MANKSSDKIEAAAICCIKDAFYESDRLSAYLPIGDKEPVWDGNIYIKYDNGETSRIPAQVKGRTVKTLPNKPSFPVTVTNLQNYKRDGGVIYFVVYIIGNQRYPFYNCLAPLDLKRYIKAANGKNVISIKLFPLENVVGQLEDLFINFDYDRKKQISFADKPILSLEEVKKKGYPIQFQYRTHTFQNKAEALRQALTQSNFLYTAIKEGNITVHYPIGDQRYKLFPLTYVNKNVICDGITYFSQYMDGINDEIREIRISDFFRMVCTKDNTVVCINITSDASLLSDYYNQIAFAYHMFEAKQVYFGEEIFILNDVKLKNKLQLKKKYRFFTRVIETLKRLHCNVDAINIANFTNQDYDNLDLLIAAILDGKMVEQKHSLPMFPTMQLGNNKIFLSAEIQNNGKYRIEDFFQAQKKYCFILENSNGQKFVIPAFSAVFMRDDFHQFINIDYESFIQAYIDAAQYNPEIGCTANNDVLAIISGYDRQTVKDMRLLEYALKLTEWLLQRQPDKQYIYQLNRLQIIKRLNGKLSEEENEQLIDIAESDVPAHAKWASCILLEEYSRAARYWKRMSEQEQSDYTKYPIYHFVQDINNKHHNYEPTENEKL